MINVKYSRKFLIIPFMIISLVITFIPASDGSEVFFPLEKVKPCMTGYGYTVFIGTKIEKFQFKVLDQIDGEHGQTKLILVRLSGKSLKKSGGLAAGMSGSPVYIGRKLVGAVSYGFENADPFLALVTPIEAMFDLFKSAEKVRTVQLNMDNYRVNGLKPVPVITPVLVAGMGSRGYELMSRLLAENGLKAICCPDLGHQKEIAATVTALRPGSAISVQMISGDYQVSAIGSVTYVNNDDFLAFGHPFTNKGDVDYLAFQAYIFQTVKSSDISFKLGSPYKIIGRITQDRQAGIAGRIGEKPDLINVIVNIKDVERNIAKLSSFQVIASEQVYPGLIISGVTDAVDKTIDRVGNGTAKFAVHIETADRAEAIDRTNMFYGKDIAVSCLSNLEDLLNVLATNEFLKTAIRTIKIDIEIQNKHVTARILKLTADRQTVKAGEIFTVNALMHTYRGDNFDVPFEIKLPDNIEPGKLILNISGGSKQYTEDTGGNDSKKESSLNNGHEIHSFSELVTKYTAAPENNELVLEYRTAFSNTDSKNSKDQAVENDHPDNTKPVRRKYRTDYYILGEAQLTVEVVKP